MKQCLQDTWAGRWGLLLLLLVLGGAPAYAQVPTWQTAVAAVGTATVQATTTDGSSIYLAGGFSGNAAFGSTTLSTTNTQELFVAKWSIATSSFVWAVQGVSTGTGQNAATAISLGAGGVYVAGNFTSATLQLGTPAALSNALAGTSDGFLARISDVGTTAAVSWSRRLGGTGNDYASAVLYTANGFVYVGGNSGGNAVFGTYTLAGASGFMAAYYTSGTVVTQPVPAGGTVTALSYANNNVYAAGRFGSATATFVDASHTLASAGGDDLFVLRLGLFLTYGWAQRAGGTGGDYARAVLATSTGVYVAGGFAGATATFGTTTLTNAGAGALFVAKLTDASTAGTFAWAVQNGGASVYNSAYALAAYGTSVYVAGTFGGTATLGAATLTSAGASDVVVAKLTDSGSSAAFVWAQQAGGAGLDYAYGLVRVGTQLFTAGQVVAPASFGSLSIGLAAGAQPGFLASLTDPAPLLTLAAPNSGPVGTTTTLYGVGLSGTTAITFAGAGATVVTSGFTINAAGTQISGVVVPSGAQTGVVNVTNAQGTSNSLVTFTVLPASNPAPAWQSVAAAASASTINFTQPDASGNILVAGTFSGSLTLGSTTLTSVGTTDLFVAKWNPTTSTYVWAQRAGSNSNDYVYGLVVQGTSIYLAGEFYGQAATFGSTTLTSQFGYAGYVAKLTDAGSSASFTWAQLVDDGSEVFIESLAVSGTSVYIGGDHTGAPLTLGSGTLATNVSNDDGFVAKFTDNGNSLSFNWVRSMGSADGSTINVYGLVARGSNVYLSGIMNGTVSFGSYSLTSAGSGDVAVVRLADQGTTASFTAALVTGGTGNEFVLNMVGQGNALYLSGESNSPTWPGSPATNAGSTDAFVLKVTDAGTTLVLNWVQLVGGAGSDRAYQLAVNGTNVYVAGFFGSSGTFGGTTLGGAGASDGFIARLADAGSSASLAWVQAAGGLANDACYAVALSGGKAYAGGYVVPAAAFGSLVVAGPVGVSVATLATLADPAILATVPAASASSLHLYPNPAHGQATVQLPTDASSLLLLDALGRPMRQQPITAGTKEVILNLEGLPVGVYLVRVLGGSSPATTHRLLVE
ncbi:MAG: T9SS type A sorting domain-containing protein [Hymenobacter sp.]|nr:MAG: T9SS type A sorting domain-containing protein [Hymenobacter sp.]